MSKNIRRFAAVLIALMLGGVILAQEPVQNIDKRIHPNLAKAQSLVAEANQYIAVAQKDNKYDMKDHAERARKLLAEANEELKLAAEAANAANAAAAKAKKH